MFFYWCSFFLCLCLFRSGRQAPVIIYGSKFQEDKSEQYSYRILSQIILCMETGRWLILKDLEDIYGSLYGMINMMYTHFLSIYFSRYVKSKLHLRR